LPADHLRLQVESHVAIITLDWPEAKNAFDPWMAGALADACNRINQEDEIKAVIIQGHGATFCCGDESGSDPPVVDLVARVAKPVIASLNGDAFGAGLELALACDIRLVADTALLAMDSLESGGFPRNGGTQRLPRLVGRAKALEMLLLGTVIDAAEAFRIGLASKVIPLADVVGEAHNLAVKMADMAPYSLRFAKEAINKGMDLTMEQGLRLEADLYFLMHTTSDRVEGITSYLQKRTPHFQGK